MFLAAGVSFVYNGSKQSFGSHCYQKFQMSHTYVDCHIRYENVSASQNYLISELLYILLSLDFFFFFLAEI